MIVESFVGILAIIVAGIMFSDMNTAGTGALNAGVASTPFQIFAAGISAVCRPSVLTARSLPSS